MGCARVRVYIRVGDGCQLLAVLSERMQRVEREKHERAARQRKALQAAEAAAAKQAARRGRSSTHSHVRRAPAPLIHTRTYAYTHTHHAVRALRALTRAGRGAAAGSSRLSVGR